MRRQCALLCLAMLVALAGVCQEKNVSSEYLQVGDTFPDTDLKKVKLYSNNPISFADLKDKWIVLDFWTRGCHACVYNFLVLDSLQRKYSSRFQFILMGYNGTRTSTPEDPAIKQYYEKYRKKWNLDLPAGFDSVLYDKLKVWSPHMIIIDPNGIVRGITGKLTGENIEQLLAGKQPRFPRTWRKGENTITYDKSLPFLLGRNGGYDTDYIFRSVLSPFKDYMSQNNIRFMIENNRMQVLGADKYSLYFYAYTGKDFFLRMHVDDPMYGKLYPQPIAEVADPSVFVVDHDLGTNLFCYSAEVPREKANEQFIRKMLQNDLKNYFGYTVSMEEREMPVWMLIQRQKTKRSNRTSEEVLHEKYTSIKALFTDMTMLKIFFDESLPFVNGTRIEDKIDIELNYDGGDMADLQRSLNENGFDLVRGKKRMQVLVIKDGDQ